MDAKSPHIDLDPELAYDSIADQYDLFTAHHDYDAWLDSLIPALESHGLSGRRMLDAGCGTGKSSLPMLRRGWEVTACDYSAAMLAQLDAKSRGEIRTVHADLRDLGELGRFDLVLCLGDVLNYCAATTPLATVLAGLRRNLAETGLLLFDLNTLTTYRTFYAETQTVEAGPRTVIWRGLGDGRAEPGTRAEAVMEIHSGDDAEPTRAIHSQRHRGEAEVRGALEASGLECLDVSGHGFDGILQRPLDEDLHTKAIYIAKARNHEEKRR